MFFIISMTFIQNNDSVNVFIIAQSTTTINTSFAEYVNSPTSQLRISIHRNNNPW